MIIRARGFRERLPLVSVRHLRDSFFPAVVEIQWGAAEENSKEDSTAGLFWCGMLGILLSLGSFPWDLLRQNAVFQVLTFSMQSPTIFMIPAICGLTFIVCGLLNTYREENPQQKPPSWRQQYLR